MNAKKNLIAAVMTAFVATGAFAQQAAEAPVGKTRAEVKAEVARARAAGERLPIDSGEASVFDDYKAPAAARATASQPAASQPAAGK
ncbi:DUF4148 domain-containing protein [Aquabacterium sp. A7-Y]|uniref:DUF4148 domain-containing protein n=1 Tax=Aquabacterium sp. A7-Y TaxID=1349605 RepID=UPI00223E6118|nr:DUF4148 domain-containing protein [Aquabacterium sp. A7-Y]MCW7540203.1 DUF4148 domain-containing protein [Aquabacterium sp. A7-Y]